LKRWFALTCPTCGFRHQLKKFNPTLKPIIYPVQIMTGGGRGKGFTVEKHLPWSVLPTLKQTSAWNSLLSLYARLAAAYDQFYLELGFLSPEIQKLIKQLQKSYTDAYQTNPLLQYTETYAPKQPDDIVEAYNKNNYPKAYAHLFINPHQGETLNG
jgi:hypothetical protein